MPFGMAKAVADVDNENQGGYSTEASSVIGFSHMHDSGWTLLDISMRRC